MGGNDHSENGTETIKSLRWLPTCWSFEASVLVNIRKKYVKPFSTHIASHHMWPNRLQLYFKIVFKVNHQARFKQHKIAIQQAIQPGRVGKLC